MANTVHGISTYELPTLIQATVVADSGVNFVVGLAPGFRVPGAIYSATTLIGSGSGAIIEYTAVTATSPANIAELLNVNTPIQCQDIADFTNAFTYDDSDFALYTLCQHAYRAMIVGKVAGSFYVNVLDVTQPSMRTRVAMRQMTFADLQITINSVNGPNVVYDSVYILNSAQNALYVLGTDYVMGYGNSGDPNAPTSFTITQLTTGSIPINGTVWVGYDLAVPTGVTYEEIVGGYNSSTQTYTGLQTIETVFPKTQIVPAIICIPTWDVLPQVAAAMEAACLVNNVFKAVAPIQGDTSTDAGGARAATFALTAKTTANIEASNEIYCWPETGLGDYIMSLSTQLAVLMAEVDISYNFIPYASPSNNPLPMDRLCLADGTTILQNKPNADLLSGQAIFTGLNWIGGWRGWGNYTAEYPATTDPKDMWIACRRMENWIENTLQLTAFQYVDQPMTQRWAEQVVDTIQQWLNSLVKVGALLKGIISLRAQDNTLGQLVGGHVIFYVEIMPPIPAQWIQFNIEVDPTALDNLFTIVTNAASSASSAIQTSTGS